MRKHNLISGQKFGYLTVISEVQYGYTSGGKKKRMIKCICECGKERIAAIENLVRDSNISCGCKNNWGINFYKHGLTKHPLMSRYSGIMQRCYNKNFKFYPDYGGRGIKVCDDWKNDFMSFYNWAISNGFKENLELDRFPNNNGNYEPNNCRWATKIQNANNTRASIKYDYQEEQLSLPEIARKEGIHYGVLYARVKFYGVSLLDAVMLAKNNSRIKKGVLLNSGTTFCKKNNISYAAVTTRMSRYKISFEDSIKFYLK